MPNKILEGGWACIDELYCSVFIYNIQISCKQLVANMQFYFKKVGEMNMATIFFGSFVFCK